MFLSSLAVISASDGSAMMLAEIMHWYPCQAFPIHPSVAIQSVLGESQGPADLGKPDNRRVRVLLQPSELLVLERGNSVQAVTMIFAYGQGIEHPPHSGVLLLCRR